MSHASVRPISPTSTGRSSVDRTLALGVVAGPVLFTVSWVVLAFFNHGYTLYGTRIPEYSWLSQPISGLGMGRTAPLMNTSFVLSAVLLAVGLVGSFRLLRGSGSERGRRWSLGLLLLVPIGCAIDGLFNLESTLMHSLGFFLATGSPIVGFLVTGRYLRGIPVWRRFAKWLPLASTITLVLFVLFFVTFTPTAAGTEHGYAGLVQRILVLEVFGWLIALGLRARRA